MPEHAKYDRKPINIHGRTNANTLIVNFHEFNLTCITGLNDLFLSYNGGFTNSGSTASRNDPEAYKLHGGQKIGCHPRLWEELPL